MGRIGRTREGKWEGRQRRRSRGRGRSRKVTERAVRCRGKEEIRQG